MDRCALFVDAGYLLADGAMAVHGTRHREAVTWDFPGLMQLLTSLSRERTGLPVLRCYWYEATVEGRRTPEHDTLADIPGLKLRLARIRPGRREGVEAQVHRDLMTLARNNAVCDAVVISGDEDLVQVVSDAQDLGIRVTAIHIAADGSWAASRTLRQECDDLIEIAAAHLRPYVSLGTGAEQVSGGQHAGSNGHPRSNAAAALPSGVTTSGQALPTNSLINGQALPSGVTTSGQALPNTLGNGQALTGGQINGQVNGQSAAAHARPARHSPPALPAYPGYTPEPQPAPALPPAPTPASAPSPAPPLAAPAPPQAQAPVQPPVQQPPQAPAPQAQAPSSAAPVPYQYSANTGSYPAAQLGPYTGPQPAPVVPQSSSTTTLAEAVKAAHKEGHDFGDSVARDAPALWLEAVLARKPRMPSDLEARLLQGSSLPIDFLLHDEVRHALRRGFWDALERARR